MRADTLDRIERSLAGGVAESVRRWRSSNRNIYICGSPFRVPIPVRGALYCCGVPLRDDASPEEAPQDDAVDESEPDCDPVQRSYLSTSHCRNVAPPVVRNEHWFILTLIRGTNKYSVARERNVCIGFVIVVQLPRPSRNRVRVPVQMNSEFCGPFVMCTSNGCVLTSSCSTRCQYVSAISSGSRNVSSSRSENRWRTSGVSI